MLLVVHETPALKSVGLRWMHDEVAEWLDLGQMAVERLEQLGCGDKLELVLRLSGQLSKTVDADQIEVDVVRCHRFGRKAPVALQPTSSDDPISDVAVLMAKRLAGHLVGLTATGRRHRAPHRQRAA